MPKISVIIPTYNATKYLQESINSILNQIYQDFEILVVDEYSTDNTLQILNSYNDPKITIIQGVQKGISATLSLSISKVKGESLLE
ncbi:MAG: glycosyltransferase family 2 protein [Brevinema sp.]